MAEEHFGTAFGVVGALDVILQRCREGFTFWQHIQDSSESAETFKVRLDMQHAKLDNWARGWGIESSNHRRNRRFCMYEQAVTNHLREINHIFRDSGSLDTPVPVLDQTRAFVAMDLLPRVNNYGASSSDPYHGGSPDLQTSPSMRGIKWAWQEDKLKEGLALLTTLLADLYTILPPPNDDPAGALILSHSLTAQDPNKLDTISRVCDKDSIYSAVAWMKSVGYRPYGAYHENNQLQAAYLVPINRKEGDTKFMARYKNELVFVEEKLCTARSDRWEQFRVLRARIDNIVVRLQSPSKPVDFRTLPCRGGVFSEAKPTTQDETTWTYSIVYRADYPRFTSLQQVLGRKDEETRRPKKEERVSREKTQFSLGTRFVLARMLARALMYLHLADWLHKAVRSENVIFFDDDEGGIQSKMPYLVGFEHSRDDAPEERTGNVVERPQHKFYRHPKAMAIPVADFQEPLGGPGRYSKAYDIYSLGVVLLEIGLFVTAETIVGRHSGSGVESLEDIRQILIEKAIPNLRFTMGNIYADATLACVDGSLEKFSHRSLHEAFHKDVVCQLDLCKA